MDTPSVLDLAVYAIGFISTLFVGYMVFGHIGAWIKENLSADQTVVGAVVVMCACYAYFYWDSIVLVWNIIFIGSKW